MIILQQCESVLCVGYHHHHHHSIHSNGNGSGNGGDVISKLDVILMACVTYHSHFDIRGRIHPSYIWQWPNITADLQS
jgi:hypothetical protein